MQCAQCQTPYEPQHNFCRECGANLPRPQSLGSATAGLAGAAVTPPDLASLLRRATLLLEQGEFVEAEGAAQAAISMAPDSVDARFVLGTVLEARGQTVDAESEYESVLALQPTHAEAAIRLDSLRTARRRQPLWHRLSNRQIALTAAGGATACAIIGGFFLLSGLTGTSSVPGTGNHSGNSGIVADATLSSSAGNSMLPQTPPVSNGQTGGASQTTARQPMGPPPMIAPPTPTAPMVVPGTATLPEPRSALPSVSRPSASAPSSAQAPALPHTLPQLPGSAGTPPASTPAPAPGLPPAAVGQVVPIAPPAAPAASGQPVFPNMPGPGVPAGNNALPRENAPANSARNFPQMEPLESDTGFIKIEPVATSGMPGGPAPGQPVVPPSISVNIAPAPAPDGMAMLQDAQRALQLGDLARRRRLPTEAERHYQHAARLFDALARRGGSTAAPAFEGLQAAQQGLASLRR